MPLGGAKDEHFYCFHSSCQLGLTHWCIIFKQSASPITFYSLACFELLLWCKIWFWSVFTSRTRQSLPLVRNAQTYIPALLITMCQYFADYSVVQKVSNVTNTNELLWSFLWPLNKLKLRWPRSNKIATKPSKRIRIRE